MKRAFLNKKSFPIYHAHDSSDCGPASLRMIAKYYGKDYSLSYLSDLCFLSKDGVSLSGIIDAATSVGLKSMPIRISLAGLLESKPVPCILHWDQNHFVVLYDIKKIKSRFAFKKNAPDFVFVLGDPANGLVQIDTEAFKKGWVVDAAEKGIALLLEPGLEFHKFTNASAAKSVGPMVFIRHLFRYKKVVSNILFNLFLASIISLSFPFLTQVLIDKGSYEKDITLVNLIILSQLLLFFGDISLKIIRGWLLLHISIRISFSIIYSFLDKLFKLPMKFFDSRKIGDFAQRIDDHHRIERFLTGSLLYSLFSIINIFIFTIILYFYGLQIFLAYTILNTAGLVWIFFFNKKRRQFDHKLFANKRANTDKIYEIVTGMQEIKLNGSEIDNIKEWQKLQEQYFQTNSKNLLLEQYQYSGYSLFTNLKNIIITFIGISDVMQGSLTIGSLLSISYILGQTNGPIEQIAELFRASQEANLSMERLDEIHKIQNEDSLPENTYSNLQPEDIILDDVSFRYEGPSSPTVLKNVSIVIPKGKITAIVGTSGCGKTTLLKVLLKFYKPASGSIRLTNQPFEDVSAASWRRQCGVVMQDGFIFNQSIAKNIYVKEGAVELRKLSKAIETANLGDFLKELPSGYDTKVGGVGGISGGQKQRILIARAVYKNPSYIFFDEATSSLDSENEKIIMNNLSHFFCGKTVIIVAHRLSTVKNADQIIVLEKGRIVESGNHESLTNRRGKYYELIKNQLELGN